MTGVFLFVTACTLKNRLHRRLRRLREPRYAAGLVAGLAYLYWFLIRNQFRRAGAGRLPIERLDGVLASAGPYLVVAGAFGLWLAAALAWVFSAWKPSITFTPAEVQFLYTAPVGRRRLLNYKLLRMQGGIIFGLSIAALFSGALRAAMSGRWSFVLGGWLLLSTIALHAVGISLTKARLSTGSLNGATRLWTAWLVPGFTGIVSGVVLSVVALHAREWAKLQPLDAARDALGHAVSGPAAAALWPFKAVVAPLLAVEPGAFVPALVPALFVLALNYVWVMMSDSVLSEAVVAAESQRARGRRAAPTAVVRGEPFSLRVEGRPELAVAWKNLILLSRYASIWTVVRVLVPVLLLGVVLGTGRSAGVLAPVALALLGFAAILGPDIVRNDLRDDLPRLAVLKTWPMSATSLLVGELLAPTLVLTVTIWFLDALALTLSSGLRAGPHALIDRVFLALAVAIVAPMLAVGRLVIQNAAVILFPGWIPTGGARPRGIEAMGQNMLTFAGTFVVLVLGVLPPVLVSGGLGFVLWMWLGWAALLPSAALFAGVLLGEAAFAVAVLGRLLGRTEPSQVEVEE
ncbi:MAG TPA: putative ABC exporter domain-containing protein [Vicinamibacterales bacterium]|jgi:hypothetical protein